MRSDAPEFELGQALLLVGKELTLGRLAPGIVHELNNPLFAILGLLELTLPELEPGSKARERLELVQRSGLEMRDIVGSVLAFAREQPEEHGIVSVADAARAAMELLRRTSIARDLEIALLEADEVPGVWGSRSRLEQLFLALLENARLAMPRGGTVRIQVAAADGRVRASVADEGCGVEPGTEERIFEPFFTTRRADGAAGLGLTLARAIARDHGGELALAESSPSGSVFLLDLPASGRP